MDFLYTERLPDQGLVKAVTADKQRQWKRTFLPEMKLLCCVLGEILSSKVIVDLTKEQNGSGASTGMILGATLLERLLWLALPRKEVVSRMGLPIMYILCPAGKWDADLSGKWLCAVLKGTHWTSVHPGTQTPHLSSAFTLIWNYLVILVKGTNIGWM